MPRFSTLFCLITVLAVCALSSAQDTPTTSLETTFLKLCSRKNPPPCVDKPPKVIHSQDPEYTVEAHNAKIEGTVVLGTVVGTDGLAHQIQVLRSLGYGLDHLALEALKKWTFKPAKSAGKAVPVKIAIEMQFRYH